MRRVLGACAPVQEQEALQRQRVDAWVPAPGSMVSVPRMKGRFKVLSVEGARVAVQLGALKLKVGLDEVRR
jgi:hypothetical protein